MWQEMHIEEKSSWIKHLDFIIINLISEILAFMIAYFIYYDYLYIYQKKDKIICKIPNWVWVILIVITLAYGVLRNM